MKPADIERFYLLDVLRALAAYTIVLMHFRFFYLSPDVAWTDTFRVDAQPFYAYLQPIYDHGATSVQIFFCMSGFIFFWLYRDSVGDGRCGGYRFFALRFTRLYPLHLATLLFVAVLHLSYHGTGGGFTAFGPNTLEQFVFQLFLATEWGLSGPSSFNGPIWTVSGEVFAYFVFFCLAATGRAGWAGVVVILLLAGLLQEANHRLGHALFFFFAGGAIYLFWKDVLLRMPLHRIRARVLPATLVALLASFVAVDQTSGMIRQFVLWFAVAPLAVLIPVVLQTCWRDCGRRMAWFGDLTYAVYLVHFPLQLVILMGTWSLGYDVDPSPALFIGYFAVLSLIAWFVFHRFELPLQRYLRRKMLAGSSVTRAVPAKPVPVANQA